ncbi:hypothetical protein [Spiroplasma turonicum]|uniref:Uncharacterized protein n=1 Tax=Spiroplasma turonicum TaxID=216946 RepID=A0A0K1P7D4_9MOLU|nr:hypothetical protein [Spiroplasma turonicum]AKU80216.1 hypothetical protein STURON_00970 [Spiroplasma turonicum]ALX71216.1 hypothetical protein STURO_v1c09650 [Spiroplasma turonicum]
MFFRSTFEVNFYLKRSNWLKYFDEYNLSRKPKFYIKMVEKKIKDKKDFLYFKHWVLWRWINRNFKISEKFISTLKRNIKKLSLELNANEEKFISDIEELIFTSWRPIKEFPVKFELDKREKISLLQSNITLHKINEDNSINGNFSFIGEFDFYFSNFKIYLTDSSQNIQSFILYDDIEKVEIKYYGTLLFTKKENYLIRGKNKVLTYVILQRLIPSLNLDITKIDNLYDYFDFNNIMNKKFN